MYDSKRRLQSKAEQRGLRGLPESIWENVQDMLQGGKSMYLAQEMHVEAAIWARVLKGQNYIMDQQTEPSESSEFSDYDDLFHAYGWKLPFWRLYGVMRWETEKLASDLDSNHTPSNMKYRALDIVCAFLGPYSASHITENHTQIGEMTRQNFRRAIWPRRLY